MDSEEKFLREKVESFKKLWKDHAYSLSQGQQDKIDVAYLEHIIGADNQIIEAFVDRQLEDSWKAHEFIGLRQAGSKPSKKNYDGFWNAVKEVVPNYSEEEINWLIKNAEIEGVRAMIFYWGSQVINEISTNAHTYK